MNLFKVINIIKESKDLPHSKARDESGNLLIGTNFHWWPPGVEYGKDFNSELKTKTHDTGLMGYWFFPREVQSASYGPFRTRAYLDIRNPLKPETRVAPEEWAKVMETLNHSLPSSGFLASMARNLGIDVSQQLSPKEENKFLKATKLNWGMLIDGLTNPLAANDHNLIPGMEVISGYKPGFKSNNLELRRALTKIVRDLGYDGYIAHDGSWVPFSKSQVHEIDRTTQKRDDDSVIKAYKAYGITPPSPT